MEPEGFSPPHASGPAYHSTLAGGACALTASRLLLGNRVRAEPVLSLQRLWESGKKKAKERCSPRTSLPAWTLKEIEGTDEHPNT